MEIRTLKGEREAVKMFVELLRKNNAKVSWEAARSFSVNVEAENSLYRKNCKTFRLTVECDIECHDNAEPRQLQEPAKQIEQIWTTPTKG